MNNKTVRGDRKDNSMYLKKMVIASCAIGFEPAPY